MHDDMKASVTQKYPVATTSVVACFSVASGVLWHYGYGAVVIGFIVYQVIRVVFNIMYLVEQDAVRDLKCRISKGDK